MFHVEHTMEKITNCYICNGNNFEDFLSCKDFTVSNEIFTIVKCNTCGFVFVNPRPKENIIGKYYESENYVSHSNTNKGLVNKVYKIVRNYTLKQKVSIIKEHSSGKKIMDIGCGIGLFLAKCKKNGFETLGIEPNENARKIATTELGLKIEDENYLDKIDNNSFDIICMWHVLEHVSNLNKRVEELKRILSKDGVLIIAVPNYLSFDAIYYKEFWAGFDVPRHLYHFSAETIKKLFAKHNMEIEKILPMKFDSFYVSMLSEKYKTKRANFFNAFLIGWKSNKIAKQSSVSYSSQIFVIRNKKD